MSFNTKKKTSNAFSFKKGTSTTTAVKPGRGRAAKLNTKGKKLPPTVPVAGQSPTKFMTKFGPNVKRRGSRGIVSKKK